VDAEEAGLAALDDSARAAVLAELRRQLRRDGFADDALVARAFAVVRMASRTLLGKAHFGTQIQGAWVLLHGNVAEMNTGEGKSLMATLAAATAALAGMKVHVVTVNDYLAGRDRDEFGPLYAALGLSCAFVGESATPEEKSAAYPADIVYCSNKTIVFDYLRDRLALLDRMQPLRLALDAMLGQRRRQLLHGLQFAIVDEADSVFVDEARTPLIISAARPSVEAEAFYREAIALAGQLVAGTTSRSKCRSARPA
jgi:preprotein translocase subunit SecA